MNRYFEDFTAGQIFKHWPGRTITDFDNTWFTLMTMNTNPLHFDAAYAATTQHGRPLVNGLLVMATVVGMSVKDDRIEVKARSRRYLRRDARPQSTRRTDNDPAPQNSRPAPARLSLVFLWIICISSFTRIGIANGISRFSRCVRGWSRWPIE
jgi:hypothetical protein